MVVGVLRIVRGVVQAAAFLALKGLARDEIAYVNHIAKLADFGRGLDALEELFGFFVEQVEACPGPLEAQVAAHDADIVGHDLSHLLDILLVIVPSSFHSGTASLNAYSSRCAREWLAAASA